MVILVRRDSLVGEQQMLFESFQAKVKLPQAKKGGLKDKEPDWRRYPSMLWAGVYAVKVQQIRASVW